MRKTLLTNLEKNSNILILGPKIPTAPHSLHNKNFGQKSKTIALKYFLLPTMRNSFQKNPTDKFRGKFKGGDDWPKIVPFTSFWTSTFLRKGLSHFVLKKRNFMQKVKKR